MIDNPDGTRRLPTKEEILEGVRQRQQQRQFTLQSNGSSIKTTIGTSNNTATENRRFDSPRPRPSLESNGRNSTNEGDEGSGDSTNDRFRREVGRTRNSYSSSDEYQQRPTASGSATATEPEQPYIAPTIKKSKFAPYRTAIQESFRTRQKKKEAEPKKKSKVFTEAEAKASKDKLVEVLLWQSDHVDEFIVATTKGHVSVIIWSNIDREQAGILADFLIARAKVNSQVAGIVRELVILQERLQVAIIVVPRMYETIMVYLRRGFSIR